MSDCTHNCETCGENCSSRNAGSEQTDFIAKQNEYSRVKHVIGVVSGKGGVGKSLVTSLFAVSMSRKGHGCAVLDADVTGPSIPKVFGITERAKGNDKGILPQVSKNGIKIMSVNLLLENDEDPVLWRGPIIAGTVKQFWTDVVWGDVDYMFVDMPPGTGDVPLTVFQSLPLDGIIIVTSPQELVSMIVKKAYNMAKMMNIPVLGIIENMSYIRCPDCGKEIKLFGTSKIADVAASMNLKVLGRIPVDPSLAELCDEGKIEETNADYLETAAAELESL